MVDSGSPEETAALSTLAAALEPVKDYEREGDKVPPSNQTPLNRVVDAVHPESEVSRRFSVAVDQFLVSSCKDAAKAAELRGQLAAWARNDARLQPLAQRSSLVQNVSPASEALSQAAELAHGALDRIAQGLPSPPDLVKQQVAALNAYEQQAHKSQLTLPARAAFQKLIEAAGSGGACANGK
jgi:hexosaminidase